VIEIDPLGAAERAAIAEEVASLLRHDLRNRLSAVRSAAFYLQRKVATTELWSADRRIPRFFGVIQEETDAAATLLVGGLRLQDLFARRLAPTDAAECVRAAVTYARVAPGTTLRVSDARSGATVCVDRSELALAVRCLVENAAEATAGAGDVEIRCEREGSHAVIRVVDRGPGIEAAALEDVLRPFFTTKDGHSGLGLNIAARIVKRYHGSLTVGPAAGGASVVIAIPLDDRKAPDAQAAPGG
jgi:signal transduction histidine kinase